MSTPLEEMNLVQKYMLGLGVEKNLKLAIKIFFEAIRNKPELASQELFYSFDDYLIISQHNKMQRQLEQEISEQDKKQLADGETNKKAEAQLEEASGFKNNVFSTITIGNEFNRYLPLAETGYPPAIAAIGKYCIRNSKKKHNILRAIAIYQKFVLEGNPKMQFQFGEFIYSHGCKHFYQKFSINFPLILLHQSAAQGYKPAQYFLAVELISSDSFRIDPFLVAQGIQTLKSLADQNYPEVHSRLIEESSHELITEDSHKVRKTFYRLVSDRGFALAAYEIGHFYATKIIIGKSTEVKYALEAIRWYSKALHNQRKGPIIFYNHRDEIEFDVVNNIITNLAYKIFFDANFEDIAKQPEALLFAQKLDSNDHLTWDLRRRIRYKVREIHIYLAKFYRDNHDLQKSHEHFEKAYVEVTDNYQMIVDSIYPKIQTEVDNFLVMYKINIPKDIQTIIASYALPTASEVARDEAIAHLKKEQEEVNAGKGHEHGLPSRYHLQLQ